MMISILFIFYQKVCRTLTRYIIFLSFKMFFLLLIFVFVTEFTRLFTFLCVEMIRLALNLSNFQQQLSAVTIEVFKSVFSGGFSILCFSEKIHRSYRGKSEGSKDS